MGVIKCSQCGRVEVIDKVTGRRTLNITYGEWRNGKGWICKACMDAIHNVARFGE